MDRLLYSIVAPVLWAVSLNAAAQSVDAARYVNAQGIEVIQGRRPPPSAVPAPGSDKVEQEAPGPTASPKPARTVTEAGQARKAAFQIGAGEQDARDRDRLAILNEEMRSENAALESKIRILQSPAMRAKLDPEQLKRLQETTLEHEKNIRALTSEINRARKSM